jgi:hypothetical protein
MEYETEEKNEKDHDEQAEQLEFDTLSFYDKYDDHAKVINLLLSSQEADNDLRDNAREAHLFLDQRTGQWEQYWWNANDGKPRYTFDQCNPIVSQIASEIEQADFDIRVSPAGGKSTKATAATYDGLIRNIENMSNSTQIYGQAARGMVTCGFDAWRVVHKYVDDNSFDQDLLVEKIANPLDRVWFDASAELQDKSDSRYCFVLHPISTEEYKSRWPEGSEQSVSDDRDGDAYYDKAEVVRVGEFLYVESHERELVMMSNGQTHEVNDDFKKVVDDLALLGVTEVRRRKRKAHKVCSRFFDASDWLEEKKDTVFNRIPVVPVYGNFKINESKTIYWGVVEKLLDPQRVMNYALSREIAEGALAPRAKYWMTSTQALGHEKELQTLNTNSDPVQLFNPDPEMPQVPQQQGGSQINAGLRTVATAMQGMMAQTSGMFAANMGESVNNQSGVAIKQLQNAGNNTTYTYSRSMEIAIGATGRLLKDAIPAVYDTERTVRILREDETFDMAEINQRVRDEQTGEIVTVNDLAVGTYDVICRAGPSFKNRQQETIEAITSLAQVDPSLMQIAGDLLLQNIATPAASLIAERKRIQMVQAGLIPQSQMTEEELQQMQQMQMMAQQGGQPDPNMIIAQAEQLKAESEMLRAQIEQAKLQNEQIKIQNDQFRLQLEAAKMQSQQMDNQADNQIDAFRAETDRMEAQIRAEEAGANVDLKNTKTLGEQINNQQKMTEMQEAQRQRAIQSMSTIDLERIARGF